MKDQQLKNYVIYLLYDILEYRKGRLVYKEIKKANKEIPNISTSYEKNSDAVYTSREFNFSNLLSKPVNSSIITSYINDEGIFLFPKFIIKIFNNQIILIDFCV
jgi:hypothetical protein